MSAGELDEHAPAPRRGAMRQARRALAIVRGRVIVRDKDSMSFDWYHRVGVDPWQMSACEMHGAELVGVGFRRGVNALRAADASSAADKCALCSGSTSIAEVRACRCNVLGIPCPIHAPKPAGVAGEWSRVRCTKCSAELQLPADRWSASR